MFSAFRACQRESVWPRPGRWSTFVSRRPSATAFRHMQLREQLQYTLGSAYTLDRELGGAGMSRVFIAEDGRLRRKVVVKLLNPALAGEVNIERFTREIALAATLQHPCIVPL